MAVKEKWKRISPSSKKRMMIGVIILALGATGAHGLSNRPLSSKEEARIREFVSTKRFRSQHQFFPVEGTFLEINRGLKPRGITLAYRGPYTITDPTKERIAKMVGEIRDSTGIAVKHKIIESLFPIDTSRMQHEPFSYRETKGVRMQEKRGWLRSAFSRRKR